MASNWQRCIHCFEGVKGAMFANKDGEKLRSNLEYLSSWSAAILAGYFAKIAIFSLFKVSHIVKKSSSYASTSSKSSFLLCNLEKEPQNWTLILRLSPLSWMRNFVKQLVKKDFSKELVVGLVLTRNWHWTN